MLTDRKYMPGQVIPDKGFLTRIETIGPRSGRDLEILLGFRGGRLAQGYSFALLLDRLDPADFEFAGTPMRSGGKVGLPGDSAVADSGRKFVSQMVVEQYGQGGSDQMKKASLKPDNYLFGPKRLCRINAVAGVPETFNPKIEYPMGHSAGTQWYLSAMKSFYVAAFVDENAVAHLPGKQKISIRYDAPYENRHWFRLYLESAKPGLVFRP